MAGERFDSNRYMQEQSLLRFMFPQPGPVPIVVTLPFYENISIKESQSPRYGRNEVLGRGSSLFTYTGSKSRQFKLTFNLTYPLIDWEANENPVRFIARNDLEDLKTKMKAGKTGVPFSPDKIVGTVSKYYDSFSEEAREALGIDDLTERHVQLMAAISWWVNIIRASVVNNSKNPSLGPPIIMLKHGLLYQDVKCICTKFGLTHDDATGYDKDTLIPRVIRISMDLEEVRMGDFSEYEFGHAIKGDNQSGWEAVFDAGTMDPANDEF